MAGKRRVNGLLCLPASGAATEVAPKACQGARRHTLCEVSGGFFWTKLALTWAVTALPQHTRYAGHELTFEAAPRNLSGLWKVQSGDER